MLSEFNFFVFLFGVGGLHDGLGGEVLDAFLLIKLFSYDFRLMWINPLLSRHF